MTYDRCAARLLAGAFGTYPRRCMMLVTRSMVAWDTRALLPLTTFEHGHDADARLVGDVAQGDGHVSLPAFSVGRDLTAIPAPPYAAVSDWYSAKPSAFRRGRCELRGEHGHRRRTRSRTRRAPRRVRSRGRPTGRGMPGGATPSSTRCTCGASPTPTATARATSRASAPGSTTSRRSASTRSGSLRGTAPRSPTAATTWPTTGRSTRPSAISARPSALIAEAAGAGHPHHRRRRAEPRVRPARVVHGGPRRGAGQPRARALLVPPRPRRSRRAAADRLDLELRRRRPGRGSASPTAARRMVPAPLLGRTARPQLGPPRRRAEHEDVLRFWFDRGRRRRPHRLRRVPRQGPRHCRSPRPTTRRRRSTRTSTAMRCTTIYRAWRAVADCVRSAAHARRGGVARDPRPLRAVPARPTRLHSAFNFDFMTQPWSAAGPAPIDRESRSPGTPASTRPRPGRSRTTTSPGPSPATGAPTAASRSTPSGSACRATSPRHSPGPAPPRCSSPPCPARSTCTRATSSAFPRSRTSRSTCAPTRCTHVPAASTPVATDAACRCPGAQRRLARLLRRRAGRRARPRPPRPRRRRRRPRSAMAPAAHRLGGVAVEAQEDDPTSTLALYRSMLALRRDLDPDVRLGRPRLPRGHRIPPRRPPPPDQSRRRRRRPPPHRRLLLASGPTTREELPGNTSAWLES